MTCKRCEDIHVAQKEGKTQEACKCSCHNTNNWVDLSGGATATDTTCFGTDTSGIWNITDTGSTSNVINFTTSVNVDEATKYNNSYKSGNSKV